jgi:hypothetical protein
MLEFARQVEALHAALSPLADAFFSSAGELRQDVLRQTRRTTAGAAGSPRSQHALNVRSADSLLLARCQVLVQMFDWMVREATAVPADLQELFSSNALPEVRPKRGRPPERLKNNVARNLHECGASDDAIADALGLDQFLENWEERVRNWYRAPDTRSFVALRPRRGPAFAGQGSAR